MKFILIVVSDDGKEEFFGPFDSGEQALDWGEKKFYSTNKPDRTIASVPLQEPKISQTQPLKGLGL